MFQLGRAGFRSLRGGAQHARLSGGGAGAKALDHLRGTGMSQTQPGASSGNLFRLAAFYLLLSFGDSAYAQSPYAPRSEFLAAPA